MIRPFTTAATIKGYDLNVMLGLLTQPAVCVTQQAGMIRFINEQERDYILSICDRCGRREIVDKKGMLTELGWIVGDRDYCSDKCDNQRRGYDVGYQNFSD